MRRRRTNPSQFRDPRPKETVKLAPQPAQERFLSSPADICIGGGAAGGGKALALDTPVSTSAGWRQIGDLCVGDRVLDLSGKPLEILATSGVMTGRPCYQLTFCREESLTYEEITADADHLWMVNSQYLPRGTLIRSTKELAWSLDHSEPFPRIPTRSGKNWLLVDARPVHSVPVQCITVDSPDGMFLCGKNRIPTHNSWSLLFEALRHCRRPGFTGLIFRRVYPEITTPGGLWQESGKAYPLLGGVANQSTLTWHFPDDGGNAKAGGVVKFGSLQHEQDVQDYRGAQICYLAFDQLETFTEYQFFYMLTRNRPSLPCTIRPYVRATANPEPGWLAQFLGWWIGDDGYPDPVRIGKIRWLLRLNDENYWDDSWQQLHERYPDKVKPETGKTDLLTGRPYLPAPPTQVGTTTVATGNTEQDDERIEPKSVTFIPFKLQDNPHLYRSNPSYRANLEAAPHIEKMRLLHGNWYVSSAKGEWPSEYFENLRFKDYPNAHWIVSVLACDPSKGRSDRFGDYAAWTWLRVDSLGLGPDGKHLPGTLWFDAWLGKWTSTELIEEGLRIGRLCGNPPMVFEVNGFQELLAGDFARLCVQRGVFPRVWGIVNNVPKPVRIRRWGPFLAQRRVKIRNSPGADLLVNQLRAFGPNDPTLHDDGPDSGEMAIRIAEYLLYGRDALEDQHNPPVPLAITGLDGMYSEGQLRNGNGNGMNGHGTGGNLYGTVGAVNPNWMYGNNVPDELQPQRRLGQ